MRINIFARDGRMFIVTPKKVIEKEFTGCPQEAINNMKRYLKREALKNGKVVHFMQVVV